jgi:hypothetical protein
MKKTDVEKSKPQQYFDRQIIDDLKSKGITGVTVLVEKYSDGEEYFSVVYQPETIAAPCGEVVYRDVLRTSRDNETETVLNTMIRTEFTLEAIISDSTHRWLAKSYVNWDSNLGGIAELQIDVLNGTASLLVSNYESELKNTYSGSVILD